MNPVLRRWVIFGVALVTLAVLLSMCFSTSNGASAGILPAQVAPADGGGIPVSFNFHADPVTVARSTGPCWEIKLDHWWKNGLGRIMYWDANSSEWCANLARTKVTALPYNFCRSQGGFFSFDGCKAEHGSTGYSYLGMHSTFRWHFIVNGLNFDRTQEVEFRLYPNGNVTGTWYWWG